MLACQSPSLFCRLQPHEDFCQPAALHITGENYEGGELKGLGLIKVTVIFKEELKAARPVPEEEAPFIRKGWDPLEGPV